MKILKPGKVEMRKFVCLYCGCVLVADEMEVDGSGQMRCPTCEATLYWGNGEPYEEPTHTQTDRERLDGLMCDLFNREPISRECIVEYLINNGVTFREG